MIYLDHNATSPARPEVVDAMLPYLTDRAGNPSSVHGAGRAARKGLDEARRRVAAFLNVHYDRVVFTSGGTESNNAALFGLAAKRGFAGHLVVSAIEHPSVLEAVAVLENRGMAVSRVPVDDQGRVSVDAVRAALRDDTILVSVMHANNETGVVQPIAEIGELCRSGGVVFHSDGVQAVGKLAVDLTELPVDLYAISAHKFGGPKGIGALVMDKSLSLAPLLTGGGQERGRRSGTENLPGIVGFGAAAELLQQQRIEENARLTALRETLEHDMLAAVPGGEVFGAGAERLPNTTALGFPGLDGEALVMTMDLEGFAISSGSACASGKMEPSHVIRAMTDDSAALAAGMVRVTLGWNTEEVEVARFVRAFARVVKRLREMAGPFAAAS